MSIQSAVSEFFIFGWTSPLMFWWVLGQTPVWSVCSLSFLRSKGDFHCLFIVFFLQWSLWTPAQDRGTTSTPRSPASAEWKPPPTRSLAEEGEQGIKVRKCKKKCLGNCRCIYLFIYHISVCSTFVGKHQNSCWVNDPISGPERTITSVLSGRVHLEVHLIKYRYEELLLFRHSKLLLYYILKGNTVIFTFLLIRLTAIVTCHFTY